MPPERKCWAVYMGVKEDFSEFQDPHPDGWLMLGGVVDSPFSLVADTLLLPYDIYKLDALDYQFCQIPNKPQPSLPGE